MPNEEQQKEEWKRIYDEYEEAEKKYKEYTNLFFTKTINGEITQKAKEFLTREKLDKIIKIGEERNKKAKEYWDFVCSMTFPK